MVTTSIHPIYYYSSWYIYLIYCYYIYRYYICLLLCISTYIPIKWQLKLISQFKSFLSEVLFRIFFFWTGYCYSKLVNFYMIIIYIIIYSLVKFLHHYRHKWLQAVQSKTSYIFPATAVYVVVNLFWVFLS